MHYLEDHIHDQAQYNVAMLETIKQSNTTCELNPYFYTAMSLLTSTQVRPGDQPGYPPISRVASLAVDS